MSAEREPSGGPRSKGSQAEYFKYAGVGIQFAGTFLAFGALGWWLDGKLGTTPWLMMAGILLGAAGAFWSLVRRVLPDGLFARHRSPPRKSPPHDPRPPAP
jgi:F0F1-type ATP synthase assembly protein I